MAFGAMVVYLTAATTLLLQEKQLWDRLNTVNLKWAASIFVILAAGLWIRYIYWQFGKRLKAATMVRACDVLLTKWVDPKTKHPEGEELELRCHDDEYWPSFLIREVKEHQGDQPWRRDVEGANSAVYVAMGVFTILLIVRILLVAVRS